MKIEGLKAILRGIHVLDGGPASELEYRGSNISTPLWSAQVLEDEPEKQLEVHRAFIESRGTVHRHVQLPGFAHGRGGCNDRIFWHSRPSLRSKKSALSARRPPHGRICTDGSAECAALVASFKQTEAVGVNCVPPKWIPSLIAELRAASNRPVIVYPNSGEGWNAANRCSTRASDPTEFGAKAAEWFKAGAQVVGGCCRTRPSAYSRGGGPGRGLAHLN
jgi:S-methylmethionine-dependent homocysteine/selenocysteine methylase